MGEAKRRRESGLQPRGQPSDEPDVKIVTGDATSVEGPKLITLIDPADVLLFEGSEVVVDAAFTRNGHEIAAQKGRRFFGKIVIQVRVPTILWLPEKSKAVLCSPERLAELTEADTLVVERLDPGLDSGTRH